MAGLLTLLKSIQKPCHLRDFAGKTLAVDAYGWLHRGAVACAIELATDKPTTKVLDFAMHRVRMLLHFGVTPYLVFDGDRLPSKAATERSRRDRRKDARSNGMEYLRVGKIPLAFQELQKAVDITPEIARMFIETLKNANVSYVVAPYEADSQMVYLEQNGIVDGIISEDSDLLVFGAKCLLTKLDQYGECIMVNKEHFTRCREINLTGWTNAEFRSMAILSGCDYLDGINKMGLKTAHRLVRKYKTIDRILRGMMLENKLRVPPNYHADFLQAERTFLYQWVFCPNAKRLVHFNELPEHIAADDLPYIGTHVEVDVARQVAEGELNPMTKERIFLTSEQWGSVQKHLQKHPSRRPRVSVPSASSDLQKPTNKAIDSFFKPKRVPLAALDPNAFKPSDSQQALLNSESNSQSWRGQSASEEQIAPAQRAYSVPITPVSAPHPTKRRRLCNDSPDKQAVQTEKSKFFGSVFPSQKDPSGSRKSQQNPKTRGFNIFSDDSPSWATDKTLELKNLSKVQQSLNKGDSCNDKNNHYPLVRQENVLKIDSEDARPARANKLSDCDEVSPFTAALHSQTRSLREINSSQAFALSEHKGVSVPCVQEMTRRRGSAVSAELHSTCIEPSELEASLFTPVKPASDPAPNLCADVIWDSPPAQIQAAVDDPSTVASLKFDPPAWLPDDSGYASQLETLVPKGSEDLLASATGPGSSTPESGSVQDDVCVADSSPVVRDEKRPTLDLARFVFGRSS
ncbi:MAG: hypothetical protein Q9162_005471 [Coniocarpon cinnabarinum]